MVAPQPRIASAFVVSFGPHGAVSDLARQRGICRQRVYREAAWVQTRLDGPPGQPELDRLRQDNQALHQRLAEAQQRLGQAVLLDRDKQRAFACLGQALGVGLADLERLLDVLLPGQAPTVATLGRWTQAAGQQAGAVLAVLDEALRPVVRQAAADEIYVKRPTLMVVEPDSLCWVTGRLTDRVDGDTWAAELGRLANLEQVTHDAGSGLAKGVATLNQQRQEAGQPPVADQLDHFHTLREGARGLGRAERAAKRALAALDRAEAALAERRRHGQALTGCSNRLRACWPKASQALAAWEQQDRAWQAVRGALLPFTPDGELNARARAEAVLAEALPGLPDAAFGTTKRLLQRPQTLTYVDEIQRKLEAVPVAAEVVQAAVRQEGLRRRPELCRGESAAAAALRGVLLVTAVVLSKAGAAGEQAVQAVRSILRSSWRASSLVECVNGALRMQQARHRKVSQNLLDLKRLYWNCHRFRTGRRRGTTPYERVGVPWPPGVRWWEVLTWPPERLREQLSAPAKAA